MGTGDHSPIYSKQYPASNYDQEVKFQETHKISGTGSNRGVYLSIVITYCSC